MAAQSAPPALWVVVDDGSTDETPAILDEYSRRLPYLRVVRRADRGSRKVGPGVMEAFYAGLDEVCLEDFDYLCKLDMDLELPVRYFELLMQRMEDNPRIGTTSGKPWFVHPKSAALAPEICGDEMSVGMTKFYRVACFKEIGGFVREVMWDGIDCHRARMLGWIAESVDLEPLRFLHLRPQGASHKGIWTGRVREGFGQYFMGTSPLYCAVAAVHRLPALPGTDRQRRHNVGLSRQLAQGPSPLRRSGVSGASSAPTSTPACKWASAPPPSERTPSRPTYGMPSVQLHYRRYPPRSRQRGPICWVSSSTP